MAPKRPASPVASNDHKLTFNLRKLGGSRLLDLGPFKEQKIAKPKPPSRRLTSAEVLAMVKADTENRHLELDTNMGICEAREAMEEWKRSYKRQKGQFAADRRREDKELGLTPLDPDALNDSRIYEQGENPESQKTPSSSDDKDTDSDFTEAEKLERSTWEAQNGTYKEPVESDIRPPVDEHTNNALKDIHGQDMLIKDIDMQALSDPFDDDARLKGDEVFALLQCVRFDSNPAANTTRWPQALAMAHLPYPLREVPFLEQFVKPLFQADDWVKCEYCRAKFRFRELAWWNWDASYEGRITRCDAIARRVVAVVNAMEKEWQALLKQTEPRLIAESLDSDRHHRAFWALGRDENTPTRTYTLCRAVYVALQQRVSEEKSEHDCDFWSLRRAVALLRAEKWMEAQLTGKPIGHIDLPVPHPRHESAKSLLTMLGALPAEEPK